MAATSPKSTNTVVTFTNSGGASESIILDAVISEGFDRQVDVTEHPVEKGYSPTDHVRQKPETLKLDVLVADYPLKSSDVKSGFEGRALQIFERFARAQEKAELVSVKPAIGEVFSNLVVQSLSKTKTKEIARDGVKFSVSFRKLVVIGSESVRVEARPKISKAKPKKDLGKQNGKPETLSAKDSSFLFDVLDR